MLACVMSTALRRGSLEWLENSTESQVVTFLHRLPNEEMLVAINFSHAPFTGLVKHVAVAGFTDVGPNVLPPLPPDAPAQAEKMRKRKVELHAISLDAWGHRILRRSAGVPGRMRFKATFE
jgi:hypothetical protein